MRTRPRLLTLALSALLTTSLLTACAAKGVRNQTRVGALTLGEAVLALDRAEQAVVAAQIPGYDTAAQTRVSAGILQVLYATRAYERAVAAWPASGPVPEQIATAKVGISRALDDLVAALPALDPVRGPILKAIEVLRAAVAAATMADAGPGPVVQAQLPPQVMGLFALAQLFAGLLASGRTTYARLRETLQKEGATDDELAALDLQISDAIARREAQQAAGAGETQG